MKDGKFNGGNPSYPVATNDSIYAGLTKRELFAAMAMQGYCARDIYGSMNDTSPSWLDRAKLAVLHADALLAELEKAK